MIRHGGFLATNRALLALSFIMQETFMSIVRLIHITLDPSEAEKAVHVWKTECAPLMIQQKGCISEKLLRCRGAQEFISYSEWDSEADIATYMASDAHKEIVRHARALKGSKAVVKLYELVQ
jgi:heme-degrading monooxygenase HmoA